jgi:hypothetical protein
MDEQIINDNKSFIYATLVHDEQIINKSFIYMVIYKNNDLQMILMCLKGPYFTTRCDAEKQSQAILKSSA